MVAPPPVDVVRAFGGTGAPVLLDGGGGGSWRCGDVVLKAADAAGDETRTWLDRVVRPAADATGLRIAFPAPALDGSLRVDGWEATTWLPGHRPIGRWHERAGVARRFAAALRDVDPAGLPRRDDPWAVADRASWAEEVGPLAGHPLQRVTEPLPRTVAVVHGDPTGNTLVQEGLAPAMIDLSLYARPREWSVAVLTVDVVAFEGAPLDLVRTMSPDPDFLGLVARVLLFRMTTDALLGRDPDAAYRPLTDAVLRAAQ